MSDCWDKFLGLFRPKVTIHETKNYFFNHRSATDKEKQEIEAAFLKAEEAFNKMEEAFSMIAESEKGK